VSSEKVKGGNTSKEKRNILRDKSHVDDMNKERGIVSSRVAFTLRSGEIKPIVLLICSIWNMIWGEGYGVGDGEWLLLLLGGRRRRRSFKGREEKDCWHGCGRMLRKTHGSDDMPKGGAGTVGGGGSPSKGQC
jgi:hypothetical protein